MLGPKVADGRTSEVFRLGDDAVVKVPRSSTPTSWLEREAEITRAVRELGLPVPEVGDVIDVEGRPSMVLEYVPGPSMWAAVSDHPGRVTELAAMLVDLQAMIHASGLPDACPALTERLVSKLDAAEELAADERAAATASLVSQPTGAALLHGDLHPGNVLMSPAGPVVIDWFDAAVGHPCADYGRTRLLLRPDGATDLRHLPGASSQRVQSFADAYDSRLAALDGSLRERSEVWLPLFAAGRLAERTDTNVAQLTALWRSASPSSNE